MSVAADHAVDPALRSLVAEALLVKPPPAPTSHPAAGQSRSEWAAEVAALREAHIAFGRAQRAQAGGVSPPVVEVAAVRDITVPVADGAVQARVYTPLGEGPFPILVVFHGGGFWLGGEDAGMDDSDPGCRLMAAQAGALLLNVDYRQAPEHKFPVPLEDCYAVTAWVAEHAEEIGGDAARLVVVGASAGGNLAAGVTLLARDRGGPRISGQVLMVPTTDATVDHVAASPNRTGFELTTDAITEIWRLYTEPDDDRTDPRLSPLLAPDLSRLPPAHVIVGEFDPLRDEGLAYAERLRLAGVPTTCTELHMTHTLATPDVAAAYLVDLVEGIKRGFGPDQ